MEILIKWLNQTLRSWVNYHRHVVSSEAFSRIDTYVFEKLWRMLRKRHPKKSQKWLFKNYWTAGEQKHIFAVKTKTEKGVKKIYQAVVKLTSIGIKRHIKVKAAANPYLPEFSNYFWCEDPGYNSHQVFTFTHSNNNQRPICCSNCAMHSAIAPTSSL